MGCWRDYLLERGADLHMAQRFPLPLTVFCFSKIQIVFTFLVPAHPGSPGQRAVKRVCVCVFVCLYSYDVIRDIFVLFTFEAIWFDTLVSCQSFAF